jgi:hypothetical protein
MDDWDRWDTWAHWRGAIRRVPSLCALTLALCLALGLAPAALAAPVTAAQARITPAAPASGHVTVIVLDMSGSMAQNDPLGLRCSAAGAYIDLSGPGDFVGVVGLDNPNGATGGPHNFPTTVDWQLLPRELSTVSARQTLRAAIQQKSNSCHPDGATPTYDALARAAAMLAAATNNGAVPGSVILLTDGEPFPSTQDQQSAITTDLVPQFKAHNWPVDVIALGANTGFHGFLSGVASATSGSLYDDGHGIVPGVSPLNIMPFFLDIFRLRNGRSPGPDIAPTPLSGGAANRNFTVGQFVKSLDIVVVKDSPAARVTLLAPNGERFPPATAGTFVSTDPYYAIFSISTPQPGAWEVDVAGSGQFLMNSLKTSSLTLAVAQPAANAVLALGEPFTVAATLSSGGTPVSGGRFSLSATLTYVAGGSAPPFARDLVLADANGSGSYSAPVTVPTSAPTGSYRLSVTAHAASEDVLSAEATLRLDLFPAALLVAPATGKPTTETVGASVTGWDAALRAVYRLPILSWLSGPPLAGSPADPQAVVRGQVLLDGKPYAQASVTGVATRQGAGTARIPVTIANDGNGAFHLVFPSDASGTYAVALTTTGAFNISHGDLTHVTRNVLVTVTPATTQQELRAWAITALYLLLLIFLLLLIRYGLAQKPFGMLMSADGSGGSEFARARRGLAALFAPGAVTSRQMGLDPGLRFGFHRGGRITVRGTAASANYRIGGERVPHEPISAGEGEITLAHSHEAYTVVAGRDTDTGAYGDEDEAPPARKQVLDRLRGRRPATDDDDDDDDDDYDEGRPRRGFALFAARRRRDDDDDFDADDDDGSRTSRRTRSTRARYDDDDNDDDRYARRPRGRSRRRYDDDDD